MSKREEAEQAIREWREAYRDRYGWEAPETTYEAAWVRVKHFRPLRVSALRKWTGELRARTAARASETDKEQAQP